MSQSSHCQTLICILSKRISGMKAPFTWFIGIHMKWHSNALHDPAKLSLQSSSPASEENRTQALQGLQWDLKHINTPSEVVEALTHGINMWLWGQHDPEYVVRAQTAGSLKNTGMLLTMAFYEQFHTIGWYKLFHGRISKLWGQVVLQLTKSPYPSFSTTWAAQLILYLWKYTRSLWEHRNQVVHGRNCYQNKRVHW